jgi:hypothetical protein
MKLNLFAMKKIVLFIVTFIFTAVVCTGQKQVDYTLLGVYTPYQMNMEKLNGKVEKVMSASL